MTDLDRFKRRLIRSVARMMQNQVPEEVAWEELQKATGFDCKLLWGRMKALTTKKLQRLLAVEDQVDSIVGAAKMSLTDWLLFDLVLAHDKIDLIGKKNHDWAKEKKALKELFKLVQQFNLEPAKEDQLEGWMKLTKAYNINGRKCSPMLLQRRWYQMKEATRAAFYKLWSSYRGNQRLWDQASKKPTLMEAAIAKRYPHIITHPFPEWGELVQKGVVVLPEQFEMKSRNSQPKQKDDKPDLMMIEPVIETIDVASDDESPMDIDETSSHSNNLLVNIKQEPQDLDGLSNVKILETSHMDVKTEYSNDSFEAETTDIEIAVEKYKESTAEASNFLNITQRLEQEFASNAKTSISDNSDDLIKQKAEEFIRSKQNLLKNIDQETSLRKIGGDAESDSDDLDDIIKQRTEEYLKEDPKVESKPDVKVDEANFADAIEFVDDGIEYVEEDEESDSDGKPNSRDTNLKIEPHSIKGEMDETDNASDTKGESDEADNVNTKIDRKLLLLPVVYTLKLDKMNVFKDTSFLHVNDTKVLDTALVESKPISSLTVTEQINDDDDNSNQMDKDSNNDFLKESSNDEAVSDDEISEHHKVKLTSYLLQKPKSRSYNPIQLCKNPDFNTRLKRLNVGFFTSMRNRQLLNACMPVTIDLHKAFEPKLIDGTLYLKSGGKQVQSSNDVETPQITTVMPVAMPAQSLLSSEKPIEITSIPVNADTVDLTQSAQEVAERNKVINLRDLSEIRRINQKLLTAEVTPIRIENKVPSNPVHDLITDITNEILEQESVVAKSVTITSTSEVSEVVNVSTADEPEIIGMSGGQQTNQPADDLLEVDKTKSSQEVKVPTCSSRGRGRGRGKGIYIWCKPKPKPPSYAQLPQRKITAPWLNIKQNTVVDEGLITFDTLNRMIGKLGDTEGYTIVPECINRKKSAKTTTSSSHEVESDEKVENSKKVVEVTNVDNSANTSNDSSTVPLPMSKTKTKKSKPKAEGEKRNFCCWAREKMVKIVSKEAMKKRHRCKEECNCCCRDLLYEQIAKKEVTIHYRKTKTGGLRPVFGGPPSPPSIVLSDDESEKKKEEVPTPVVRIVNERYVMRIPAADNDAAAEKASCGHESNECGPACGGRGIHLSTTAITAANVTPKTQPPVILNPLQTNNPVATPSLKVNISFTSSVPTRSVALQPQMSAIDNVTEEFQTIEYNPVPPPQPQLPNLCPKLTIDPQQRKIVIDGSVNKPMYRVPNIIKKSVYLKSQKTKECPIYLGQNKILLTTVKFPPDLEGRSTAGSVPAPVQPSIVTSNLPMSYGVQLVLLPNGELTYTVDPSVTLSEQQLAMMPSILAAVKQQLNLSQIQTDGNNVSQGVVDLTENNVTNENAEIPTVEGEVEKESEKQESGETINSVNLDDDENVSKLADPVVINDAVNEQINVATATEKPTSEKVVDSGENIDNANVNTNENVETRAGESNDVSRNLLSDLMEMSGISTDDTTTAPQESVGTQVESIMPVALDPPVAAPLEPIVATPMDPLVTAVAPPTISALASLSSQSNIVSDSKINYSALTPVNSLAELKYACAQNGLFFKLDVETGSIVPINVSVKKKNKRNQPITVTKSVIDLTDDVEQGEASKPIPQPGTLDYDNTIKPVKLFRSVPVVPKVLEMKRKLVRIEGKKVDAPQPFKRHIRKQALEKIEAKIDLVDSDAPMEEEYLLDSDESDSEKVMRKQRTVPASKSDDSSDEEPLAAKSKRLRTNESVEPNTVENRDVSPEQEIHSDNVTEDICDENDTQTQEESINEEAMQMEGVEEADDDMDIEHPTPQMLTFFADDPDSQEDCILGV